MAALLLWILNTHENRIRIKFIWKRPKMHFKVLYQTHGTQTLGMCPPRTRIQNKTFFSSLSLCFQYASNTQKVCVSFSLRFQYIIKHIRNCFQLQFMLLVSQILTMKHISLMTFSEHESMQIYIHRYRGGTLGVCLVRGVVHLVELQ